MRSLLLALPVTLAVGCTCAASHVLEEDAAREPDAPPGIDAPVCADSDGDGLADRSERVLDAPDADGDGVPNEEDLDSDGDGVSDRDEAVPEGSGGPCLFPVACNGCARPRFVERDSDADGVEDADELARGLEPCSFDTDGDRCPDGLEDVGCGPERVVFLDEGCATATVMVAITVPGGVTSTEMTLVLDRAPEDRLDRLEVRAVSATPALASEGATFRDVPAGAQLTFEIRTTTEFHEGGIRRLDTTVRLVDAAGATIESRPFHYFEPECCFVLI